MNIEMQESNSKKIHSCPFAGCDSVFNRPYRLAQHRLVHINVKPFACLEENCTKAYTSKSHLDRHFNSVHKKKELGVLHSCPICMKKYVNRQNLRRHVKVNHTENCQSFICDYCKQLFKKKHQLNAHMYRHNGIKAFRCPLCSKEFISFCDKRKHMRNHNVYECEHCHAQFYRWMDLITHRRVEHQSPEYICHDCGKIFRQRTHIIRHVKKHLPNGAVAIFFCPYKNCNSHYSRKSNLNQHISVKHEGRTYDCTLCEARLSTKAKLNEHIERHSHEAKARIPKTLQTGRRKRKDENTMKITSALKLAGLVKVEMDDIEHEASQTDEEFFFDINRQSV